jgi:hypothetical protein
MGMGSMTGRGVGYCAGFAIPGFVNGAPGRGGGGWGRRNWFRATGLPGWQRSAVGVSAFGAYTPCATPYPATMPQPQELDLLKGQVEYFEDALNGVRKRIEELEAKTAK